MTIMVEQIEAAQGADERLGSIVVIFFFVGNSFPESEGLEELRFRFIRFEVQQEVCVEEGVGMEGAGQTQVPIDLPHHIPIVCG